MKTAYKIIILEDDLFFGKVIRNFLINQGYENVELYHHQEDCLKQIDSQPTILIIDHFLPNYTGIEVVQQIRKLNSNIKFIYLSGQDSAKIAIKSLKEGAVDYIEKNNEAFSLLNEAVFDCILQFNSPYKHNNNSNGLRF